MAEEHPSLGFLLEQYEGALAQLRAHFEGADRKIAALIVASGVLIGLSPAMSPWFLLPGMVALICAGALALWAYWPRKYPIIRPERLRDYLNSPHDLTRVTVLDTYEVMILQTEKMVINKGLRLKMAFAAFAVAAIVFAIGIVGAAAKGGPMPEGPEPTPDFGTPEEPPPRRPDLSLIGYIEEAPWPDAETQEPERAE